MTEHFPAPEFTQPEDQPHPAANELPQRVVEVEAAPGVYEVYDSATGELIDVSGGEEEL